MIQDLRFLRNLWSNKKAVNAVKNHSSYLASRLLRSYVVWGKPSTFIIEPTSHCNLRCPQCPVGLQTLVRPQGYLQFDDYRRIIDDIAGHTWLLLLFFQGESFINPDIIRMIDYAYERGIFVTISTNGTRLASPGFAAELAASKLGRLILSVDGATEETYKVYRQAGHFYRVLKGVKHFTRARKELGKRFPRADLQFIVMRHNEHEMADIKQLGRELEVDRVIFKSPQLYDFADPEATLPANPRYRRYEQRDGEYRLKGSYSGYCKKLWYGAAITWDKQVIPCCFDKDADYTLGNMADQPFAEVWEGNNYHHFRRMVMRDRDSIDMCRNCSEGLKIFFK